MQEGGTPSVQAAAPPLWHSINWDSGSLPEGAPPPSSRDPQSLLLAVPALGPLACLDSSPHGPSVPSQAPSIHSPVLDSVAAQQLERMRPVFVPSPQESLGAGSFVAIPISFAYGSLNINMHKNPLPSLLLSDGLPGLW